jgi:magnesium transporter
MIKALLCKTQENHFVPITDLDTISTMISDNSHIVWLDLLDPTADELAKVGEEFMLHPLALEDATNEHQRPKLEQYEEFLFVVFYTARASPSQRPLQLQELNLFVGKNYVITVHYGEMSELQEVEQRWKRNHHELEKGSGLLLYMILDTIVDEYFPLVDQLSERVEEMEQQVYTGHAENEYFTFDVLSLKKRFLEFRRVTVAERDVLNTLTNRDNPIFEEKTLLYFRDIYDHITRIADSFDIYRDQLSGLIDARLSMISNNMNQVMRTLTSASIILMILSLLAGIYGMNFKNMPELDWTYGYFALLGVMALIAIGLLIYFRRRRWL